jgi:hypothetical protein
MDDTFCVDNAEDSGLKFFGSNCEHSPVLERRLQKWGRAESVDTAPRLVPGILASLAVAAFSSFNPLNAHGSLESPVVVCVDQSHCHPHRKRESQHHVIDRRTLVERRHAAPMLIAVA